MARIFAHITHLAYVGLGFRRLGNFLEHHSIRIAKAALAEAQERADTARNDLQVKSAAGAAQRVLGNVRERRAGRPPA